MAQGRALEAAHKAASSSATFDHKENTSFSGLYSSSSSSSSNYPYNPSSPTRSPSRMSTGMTSNTATQEEGTPQGGMAMTMSPAPDALPGGSFLHSSRGGGGGRAAKWTQLRLADEGRRAADVRAAKLNADATKLRHDLGQARGEAEGLRIQLEAKVRLVVQCWRRRTYLDTLTRPLLAPSVAHESHFRSVSPVVSRSFPYLMSHHVSWCIVSFISCLWPPNLLPPTSYLVQGEYPRHDGAARRGTSRPTAHQGRGGG